MEIVGTWGRGTKKQIHVYVYVDVYVYHIYIYIQVSILRRMMAVTSSFGFLLHCEHRCELAAARHLIFCELCFCAFLCLCVCLWVWDRSGRPGL